MPQSLSEGSPDGVMPQEVSTEPAVAESAGVEAAATSVNRYCRPNTAWNCSSRSLSFVAGILVTIAMLILGMVLLKACFGVVVWQ